MMSLEPTLSIVTSILLTDVVSLTAASAAFRVSSSSTSWYTCRSAQGKVRDTREHTGTACVQLQVYAGRWLALVIYQLHSTQARTDSPPQQPTQHSTPELVPLQPVGEPREGEGGHRTLPTMGTSRCVQVTRSAKPPATTDRPRHEQTEETYVSWAIAPLHSAGLTLPVCIN